MDKMKHYFKMTFSLWGMWLNLLFSIFHDTSQIELGSLTY